ncbi:hypothetical protein JTB14_015349 [Gonioctena quinquepunctata]|nr:hypothetical protein JTB14_015349 [Gonioctena quinquepunctata]
MGQQFSSADRKENRKVKQTKTKMKIKTKPNDEELPTTVDNEGFKIPNGRGRTNKTFTTMENVINLENKYNTLTDIETEESDNNVQATRGNNTQTAKSQEAANKKKGKPQKLPPIMIDERVTELHENRKNSQNH